LARQDGNLVADGRNVARFRISEAIWPNRFALSARTGRRKVATDGDVCWFSVAFARPRKRAADNIYRSEPSEVLVFLPDRSQLAKLTARNESNRIQVEGKRLKGKATVTEQRDIRRRITKVAEILVRHGVATENTITGCTATEIEKVETDVGCTLPLAYREFLAKMGRGAGSFYVGTDLFYPLLKRLANSSTRMKLTSFYPKTPSPS